MLSYVVDAVIYSGICFGGFAAGSYFALRGIAETRTFRWKGVTYGIHAVGPFTPGNHDLSDAAAWRDIQNIVKRQMMDGAFDAEIARAIQRNNQRSGR